MKKTRLLDWDLQLPDFAAPAVLLRVALLANLCMLVGAILRQDVVWAPYDSFMSSAALGEPSLILSMLILALVWRRAPPKARSFLALFVGTLSVGGLSLIQPNWSWGGSLRSMVNAFLMSWVLCLYFDWRYRRLSPALSEAKLEALMSRMRPHFLFNAINGIVMLLSKSPTDAEEALLDLADVFRSFLKEGASFAKLSDEVALTEKYLRIEKMRFRERLVVNVKMDEKCGNVMIPTMLLQPLVENAIIHGIEAVGSGSIDLTAFVKDGCLTIVIENPFTTVRASGVRKSNGIAMENIKQRLSLLYDIDARLTCGPQKESTWRVTIHLPAHTQNQ